MDLEFPVSEQYALSKGVKMQDNDSLDEMRRRIQESLIQAKREQLRDEFGMQFDYVDPHLAPEAQNEWLDSILEFERQFENAQRITVRKRIGSPFIEPVENIPLYALEEAVNNLLNLLAENGIVIDFMGDWDDLAAYRFITDKLLDEEMDDIRIAGTFCHFEAATPEYDVQMWVENFVHELFWQERKFLLAGLDKQPLFDETGQPITLADFMQKVEAVWVQLPATKRIDVRPITTKVTEDEGQVTAVIAWYSGNEQKQVESFFRLQPSPYYGWDVVQTSLLDDLLTV
jgi:hypothetical protein